MTDPLEQIHQRLVERVRRIISDHRAHGIDPDGRLTCSCGVEGLSDYPCHLAEKVLDGIGVKPDIDEAKKRIRYASAWFDRELTQLEGAEC